ncbi:hypothetical protein LINPERHAP1_LOCUS22877, partial [Linum perenne]
MDFKNRFADYKYIARKYVHWFLIDPYWGIDSIIQTVHEDLHLQIGRDKAGRVRKHIVELARGKSSEQYARLYDYCAEVRKSNVGSTVFVEATDIGHFKRMYCCLGACKEGFLAGCRRAICIDGCFLKTEVGGQLLTTVGLDGKDGVYPIAYAAVELDECCKRYSTTCGAPLLCSTSVEQYAEDTCGANTFQVRHRDKQMVVDLNNQTCTCWKWELSGIPCSHAISCIAFMQDRLENYVRMWYRVENYMKAYGVHISPMVGLESWQKTDQPAIKPPHVNIVGSMKKGRTQTMRRKGPEETVERQRKQRAYTVKVSRKGTINKCSKCHQHGHGLGMTHIQKQQHRKNKSHSGH